MAINQNITDLPTPPQLGQDQETFDTNASNFLNAVDDFADELNTFADEVNTTQTEINNTLDEVENNLNQTITARNLAETYKNEAEASAITAVSAKDAIQSYVIPTEATYSMADIDSKINAYFPYSGYTQWKKDNFKFLTSDSFLASVADTNRYLKFGDKVVDTYLHSSYDETHGGVVKSAEDLIPEVTVQDQATYGLEIQPDMGRNSDGIIHAGDYVVVDREELVTNNWDTSNATVSSSGTNIVFSSTPDQTVVGDIAGNTYVIGQKYVIKAKVTSLSGGYVYMRLPNNDTTIKFDSVKEFTYTFTASSTSVLSFKTSGTTTLTIDNISVKQLDEVYRAKTDVPAYTSLTDTDYFEVRDNLPISNQIAFLHTMDSATKVYEGMTNEILFNDALAVETPRAIMLKNGFSEIVPNLYSKGTKWYIFAGYHQTENKGLSHKLLNNAGTKKASDDKYWYDTTVSFTSVADCFNTSKLLTASGYIASGKSGRDDGKYYDIVYENDFISFESTELAFKPTKELADEIKAYEDFRGVNGLLAYNGTTNVDVAFNSKSTKLKTQIIKGTFPQIATDRIAESKLLFAYYDTVDDNGISIVPNGSITTFKLNGKANSIKQIVKWNGTSYSLLALTTHYTVSTIANTITFVTTPTSSECYFISFEEQNTPYTATTPMQVVIEPTKVKASNSHSLYKGAIIGNCLGKIQVGNGDNGYESKVLENVLLDENFTYEITGNEQEINTSGSVIIDQNEVIYYISGANSGTAYSFYKRLGGNITGQNMSNYNLDDGGVYWEFLGNLISLTTPAHPTIALDNSTSPASKWFEGYCTDGVYKYPFVVQEEMIWDDTHETYGQATSVTSTIYANNTTHKFIYLNSTAYGTILQYKYLELLLVDSVRYFTTTNFSDAILRDNGIVYIQADDSNWYEAFKLWDGNGFGDNNKFNQLTNGTRTDLNGNTIKTQFAISTPIGRV